MDEESGFVFLLKRQGICYAFIFITSNTIMVIPW